MSYGKYNALTTIINCQLSRLKRKPEITPTCSREQREKMDEWTDGMMMYVAEIIEYPYNIVYNHLRNIFKN